MIRADSTCVRNLKVGDHVVVQLLPFDLDGKTFNEPLTFPIIGFDRFNNNPMIGTMDKELYDNHHFITMNLFYPNSLYTYGMSLTQTDIVIKRIIKNKNATLRRLV